MKTKQLVTFAVGMMIVASAFAAGRGVSTSPKSAIGTSVIKKSKKAYGEKATSSQTERQSILKDLEAYMEAEQVNTGLLDSKTAGFRE